MSESHNPFADLDQLIGRLKQQESKAIEKGLDDLIPLESQLRATPPAKKAKAPLSTPVTWVDRDSDGNIIYARLISSWKQSNQGQYCYCILINALHFGYLDYLATKIKEYVLSLY